jgi:rubrerythrin
MQLNKIYQIKHELWLKILFSSFAIKNQKIKNELYEFSNMQFRHLKWLSNELKDKNIEYNYNRDIIDFQKKTNFEYFEYIINEIKIAMRHYEETSLFARIISDEYYMIKRLEGFLLNQEYNGDITAFNKERIYENKNLSQRSIGALTIFLFEEIYKEYELILVYAYMQNYTNNIVQYDVYQDLIDESQYHLKCFGEMLSKMGILSIPRIILEQIYKRDDLKQFLIDAVEEEKMAREECRKLSEAVEDKELSYFFNFINFQEDYHMELMQKAIKNLS